MFDAIAVVVGLLVAHRSRLWLDRQRAAATVAYQMDDAMLKARG